MRIFIFFALIAAASAQASKVYYDGPCPPVRAQDNFDFQSYNGLWYEMARYVNAAEEDHFGKCTTAEYFINGPSGTVRNTHVVAGVKSYIDGRIDEIAPGKVQLTYSFGGRSKYSYFIVLKTDYVNYSIAYSCKYFPETDNHQVFSWIKSRSPNMNPNALAIVNNFLQSSPLLDSGKYLLNDFSDNTCSYTFVKIIEEFLN